MTKIPVFDGLCYDRSGQPITLWEWADQMEDPDLKRVALDCLDGAADVSTVWLGLDHSFGHGTPLIFETLIFGGRYDQHMWRYPTEEEALAGHRRVVQALIEGRNPES